MKNGKSMQRRGKNAEHEVQAELTEIRKRTDKHSLSEKFRKVAHQVATAVGSAWVFLIACIGIIVWGVTGPIFDYSNTWQLVINTGTTIITFLMVFLIQNTQN